MLSRILCLTTLSILTAVEPAFAQTSRLFQWGFANNELSTSLPTCISLPIVVKSFDPTTNATQGTPPYYMIAFAVGNTPVTTLIGSDENNLNWTVTAPVGTELILSVVDSNGSAGGIPPRPFTVIAGSTTQCVTSPSNVPAFTVTSNITDSGSLQTCQPWGLYIDGGSPPYTVTLAQPNSPVVTNVSIPFGNNLFTYINRANPGGVLIAAVSDLTGRWAEGTPIVKTEGSDDTSCTGLVSSSESATSLPHFASPSLNQKKRAMVIAISVSFGLLALGGGGIAAYIYLRRRRIRKQVLLESITPRKFVIEAEEAPTTPSIRQDPNGLGISSASQQWPALYTQAGVVRVPEASLHRPTLSSTTSLSYISAPLAVEADDGADTPDVQPRPYSRPGQRPAFSRFPTASIRMPSKAEEARTTSAVSPDSEYSVESYAPSLSVGQAGARSGYALSNIAEVGSIYDGQVATLQYQDEHVPKELPPPYVDHQEGPSRTS